MSDELDLPRTEALLRAHYAELDPGALRPDAAARIRAHLEAERSGQPGLGRRLRLEPVRPVVPQARLGVGWSLAATFVVALLVVAWLALGRPATPSIAGSPSAAAPSAVASGAASASSSPGASGGASSVPSASGILAPSPSGSLSNQLAMAFADRSRGLVVGDYQGQGAIWATADGGQTWTSTLVPTPTLDGVAMLGARAWASASCPGDQGCTPAVLTSSDGGTTWAVIASVPLQSLTFVSAEHGFAVNVASNVLVETTDGGVTWSQPYRAPCEAGYVVAGVSFGDARNGWIACESGGAMGSSNKEVLATTDGGATWTVRARVQLDQTRGLGQMPPAGLFRGIDMLTSGTGIAWLWNEGILRTTDGGVTWTRLPLGDVGGDLQWPGASISADGSLFALTVDVTSGDASATLNLGLGDGRDWKSLESFGRLRAPGSTPAPEATPAPQPAIADSGVAFFDADHGIAVGNGTSDAFLWRTGDGGSTWTVEPLGTVSATLLAVYGDRAWIETIVCPKAGQKGICTPVILRLENGGATGKVVGHQAFSSMSFGDATHGFGVGPFTQPTPGNTIGGSGTAVYATSDGGATWSPVGSPRPCGTLDPVSVSFVSATHGWLGCEGQGGAGNGPKGVMETTDGGRSWTWRARTDIGGPADIGVISTFDYLATISMQADGSGFMTGVRGATFRTTDGGRTWADTPPGEFDAFTTSAATMITGGRWFVIQSGWVPGTSGVMAARLMASFDQGSTWTHIGGLLPNP